MQLEDGLQATDNGGQWTLELPQTLVRYGLLGKTQLRLAVPSYFLAIERSNGAGFGDLGLGAKQQLGSLGGSNLAVIPSLSLPTGALRISSGGYDSGLQLIGSRTLPAEWTLAGQFAAYWPTQDGARNYTSELTLLFDRELRPLWSAYIEYATDVPQRGGSSQLIDVGTSYKLGAHHEIDFHAAVGLTHAAPRSYLGVGYSCLWLARSTPGAAH